MTGENLPGVSYYVINNFCNFIFYSLIVVFFFVTLSVFQIMYTVFYRIISFIEVCSSPI